MTLHFFLLSGRNQRICAAAPTTESIKAVGWGKNANNNAFQNHKITLSKLPTYITNTITEFEPLEKLKLPKWFFF